MKKGNIGAGEIIKAGIVILVVVIILAWAGPAYGQIRELLGFETELTPAEIESQELAKQEFSDNFASSLTQCVESSKIKCFCLSPGSFALPTDYSIDFLPEQGDIKLTLRNHLGGELLNKWVSNTDPCVSIADNSLVSLTGEAKDSKISIIYSSANQVLYTDLSNKDIKERTDNDYYIYKPNQDSLCVLRESTARLKQKDLCV